MLYMSGDGWNDIELFHVTGSFKSLGAPCIIIPGYKYWTQKHVRLFIFRGIGTHTQKWPLLDWATPPNCVYAITNVRRSVFFSSILFLFFFLIACPALRYSGDSKSVRSVAGMDFLVSSFPFPTLVSFTHKTGRNRKKKRRSCATINIGSWHERWKRRKLSFSLGREGRGSNSVWLRLEGKLGIRYRTAKTKDDNTNKLRSKILF